LILVVGWEVTAYHNGGQRQSAFPPRGGTLRGACLCCNCRCLSRGWCVYGSLAVSFLSAREMCNWSGNMYVGYWQCVKVFFFILCTWVTRNGTYVWAQIILLPVYAWVFCSSHRGIYGGTCVHYGCWSGDTLIPSFFLGCRTLLLNVLRVKSLYVCACNVPYFFFCGI
jgi:hypothetical protein